VLLHPSEVIMRFAALLMGLLAPVFAFAGDLGFGYAPAPKVGENPSFIVTPSRPVASMRVVIDAGGRTFEFTKANVGANVPAKFTWARDESVTSATAWVTAEFADSTSEEVQVPFSWTYGAPLKVDLNGASADVSARTLTVKVTAPVQKADIIAYGAGKAVLDERTVEVRGGPGKVEVPWVGEPSEVVLLDVKLHGSNAWAGFTYSPWFLDIPHEDVLFASNSDVIPSSEEPKLRHTLEQLRDVLAKYGSVVPVKLYIAGCTDTVGDSASNKDLSLRRARAIARWLRNAGYDKPIFYHGFGESLLAVSTGDEVDMQANRRALYMVGANPPPPGSGVPAVTWIPL
jgi:outer membrane protein OmpA-like peptidoglycan-associated protein